MGDRSGTQINSDFGNDNNDGRPAGPQSPSSSHPPPPPSKIQLTRLTTSTGFKFPSIFSFPPFFTKQPNQQTWAHQVSLWHQLVLAYCKYDRVFKLELSSSLARSELFHNPTISRNLDLDTILLVLESMVQAGTAEYYPHRPGAGSKTTPVYALIYFESLSSWANRIYDYVSSSGLTNTVMTLHELTDADHAPEDLIGLDPIILRKALAISVKLGKAKLFKGSVDGVGGDGDGVKFF